MKKRYSKPLIEIEAYELNAAIALNCGKIVTLGPEAPGKKTCSEFEDDYIVDFVNPGISVQSTGKKAFYAEGLGICDCYYTSGGAVYFTS